MPGRASAGIADGSPAAKTTSARFWLRRQSSAARTLVTGAGRAVTSGQVVTGSDGMTYVDSAVLDLTEEMCHRFQAWTGRTNVWLAFQLTNLSIVLYFIWAAGLYFVSGDLVLRIFVALFCGGVFFVLTRTIFKVSIEASETEAYRRVASGLRNPRRIRDAQLRIAFLTLSVVLSYPLWFAYITLHLRFVVLTEALIVLTTVVLYVLACDPLPPCTSKAREWLRGMAPARSANAPASRRVKQLLHQTDACICSRTSLPTIPYGLASVSISSK
jgi:hypothetical protein